MCIKIDMNNEKFLLFNCYLPYYDNGRNLELYVHLLAKMHSLVLDNDCSKSIIIGDFNCNVDSILFNELTNFCIDNEYLIADVDRLGYNSGSFTYVSDANNDCRWLDHVVCSKSAKKLINNIDILHDFLISDHRPIEVTLD